MKIKKGDNAMFNYFYNQIIWIDSNSTNTDSKYSIKMGKFCLGLQ